MFTVGICDDEKGLCGELEKIIDQFSKKNGIKIETAVFFTGEELCKHLQEDHQIDLIFLDIELITTNGIKVGQFIRKKLLNIEIEIVYISSESNYAMSLFENRPVDFLIKPLNTKKIENIIENCMIDYERKNQFFDIFAKGEYKKIAYKEILYFYSYHKKIYIVRKNDEIQITGKLKNILEKVPRNFVLIHQSYLININYVTDFDYETVKMQNSKGVILNVSQPYRKSLREQILKFKLKGITYD